MHTENNSIGSWGSRRVHVATGDFPGKCKVLPAQKIGAPQADIPLFVLGYPSEGTAQKGNGRLVEAIIERFRISRSIAGTNIEIEAPHGSRVCILQSDIG